MGGDIIYSVVSCWMPSLKFCRLADFPSKIAKLFGILGCDPAFCVSVSLQHHSPHYLQISNSHCSRKAGLGYVIKEHGPLFRLSMYPGPQEESLLFLA